MVFLYISLISAEVPCCINMSLIAGMSYLWFPTNSEQKATNPKINRQY